MTACEEFNSPTNRGKKIPKLLDQTRAVMRMWHYGYKTEKIYIYWMKQYFDFHNLRHPAEMGRGK
jgi:hypothetical protein